MPGSPFQASGAARLLFKTPEAGASTVLAAAVAPQLPHPGRWGERTRWRRGWRRGPYFVNCRPGGFASAQSRDLQLAREMRLGMRSSLTRPYIPISRASSP